jgi:hypothetical protein
VAIKLQKSQRLLQSKAYIISNIGFHLVTINLIYCNYQIIPREAKAFCFLHKQRTYPHHSIICSFCFQCYVQANYNLWWIWKLHSISPRNGLSPAVEKCTNFFGDFFRFGHKILQSFLSASADFYNVKVLVLINGKINICGYTVFLKYFYKFC